MKFGMQVCINTNWFKLVNPISRSLISVFLVYWKMIKLKSFLPKYMSDLSAQCAIYQVSCYIWSAFFFINAEKFCTVPTKINAHLKRLIYLNCKNYLIYLQNVMGYAYYYSLCLFNFISHQKRYQFDVINYNYHIHKLMIILP